VHVESPLAPGRHPANRNAQRIAVVSGGQSELLRAHQDTITALATIDAPFRAGIVSGDRAGVVKVWRIDGAE
jgi:phosphoinositide-3-kinase regulatory subunit 4